MGEISFFLRCRQTFICYVFATGRFFDSPIKIKKQQSVPTNAGRGFCTVRSRGRGGGGRFETTAYLNGGSSSSVFGGFEGEMVEKVPAAVAAEKLTGASMMEQLVPEITTHALSYLDYPSLCRLSMTNSLMRKAANDDNAWKALYHKDFTLEQDSLTPVNGWKAYYAATRAIMNVNADFFNIIKERSVSAMEHFGSRRL
ncbi:F-box protein skip8 [Datura stramonium]|uniref:F-box protein skip8 n=1 Tax=Datura stramonium TaxID=4076 RepID=A0ABS8RWE5_DATST|nr:F-box protein skip8 [Datura stramonium]